METVEQERIDAKKADYLAITDFGKYPMKKLETIARIGVVIDDLIAENDLQGVALR